MSTFVKLGAAIAGVVVSSSVTTSALAVLANFESRTHGQKVTNQYSSYGGGFIVTTDNFRAGHPDVAIIFDSRRPSSVDPDLVGPSIKNWAGGNLPVTTIMGNMLIIAQDIIDLNGDGLVDNPNDEGNVPAGQIKFSFNQNQTIFGFDGIDFEAGTEKANTFISFRNSSGVELKKVMMSEFVNPVSPFYDPTLQLGDNTVNRFQALTASRLGIPSWRQVVIQFGWSFAMDNMVFGTAPVPEPASLALALPALALLRRVRK